MATPEMNNDNCDVCLIEPRDSQMALVPCGHQRFCSSCANCVRDEGRMDVTFVLNLCCSD